MSFSALPVELKQQIWEYELSHERILHVAISPPDDFDKPQGASIAPGEFDICLIERRAISKVFHVDRISRAIALKFYRVHIPCRYRYGEAEAEGTFYFHPELDILEIDDDFNNCFADFAQQLWEKDPRHVGLVNLMVGTLQIDKHLGGPKQSLQKALRRLRRIIFVPEAWGPRNPERPGYISSVSAICFRHEPSKAPSTPKFICHEPELRSNFVSDHLPQNMDIGDGSIADGVRSWLLKLGWLESTYALEVNCQVAVPYGARAIYGRNHFFRHNTDAGERAFAADHAVYSNDHDLHVRNLQRNLDCEAECTSPSGFWLFPIRACIGDSFDEGWVNPDDVPKDYWDSLIDVLCEKWEECAYEAGYLLMPGSKPELCLYC